MGVLFAPACHADRRMGSYILCQLLPVSPEGEHGAGCPPVLLQEDMPPTRVEDLKDTLLGSRCAVREPSLPQLSKACGSAQRGQRGACARHNHVGTYTITWQLCSIVLWYRDGLIEKCRSANYQFNTLRCGEYSQTPVRLVQSTRSSTPPAASCLPDPTGGELVDRHGLSGTLAARARETRERAAERPTLPLCATQGATPQ